MGLMQLMPETAKMLGCDIPFDCDANLKAGSTYMAQIISEIHIRGGIGFEGDGIYRIALCGYNAGPGYCYTAIRIMRDAGAAQTWEEFKSWFPKATVKGRTARSKDAIAYAEKIVPAA
jgi:membrane-bound lytic murein transglycosylase MltF